MTDIMKLVESYASAVSREERDGDYGTLCSSHSWRDEIKKAIEALQAENADLAFLADQYKAERDALKSQVTDPIGQLIETSQNLGLYDK